MKTFLIKILLFLFFALGVYIAFFSFLGYFSLQRYIPNVSYCYDGYGYLNRRLDEVKSNTKEIDYLFLGSSHSYRGFDPRSFNEYNTFNLGSSAQTPEQTLILLRRYLEHIKPKWVVYEVYPRGIHHNGLESSFDLLSNDKNDFYSLGLALKSNDIRVYNTLVYASSRNIFNRNASFVNPFPTKEDTYISGGYVEREVTYFHYANYSRPIELEWNTTQWKNFLEIIELIKSSGARVVLVYAPITPNLYEAFAFNEQMDSVYNSLGVPYINYNNHNVLNLDDSLHFYDSHHMNQIGVNIFNRALVKDLEKLRE